MLIKRFSLLTTQGEFLLFIMKNLYVAGSVQFFVSRGKEAAWVCFGVSNFVLQPNII